MRFRLAYVEGLRPAGDTASQRMGTNWHAMHEVYAKAGINLFDSPEHMQESRVNAVVEHLNQRYANMPVGMDAGAWALERTILLTSFLGYLWRWSEDPVEFLDSELAFELPVHLPRSGMPLSTNEAVRVGKIDHVIKWRGAVCALERKSTSKAIGPDSDYWDRSKKDTQVSMYALAFRDMKLFPEEGRKGNTLYDVWHKPTIKPAMLTQKETAAFLESGVYCDVTFDIPKQPEDSEDIIVGGVKCEVEVGKKGFAIRETLDMYAARLLADIYTRPDYYFERREIVRTDAEIAAFRQQVYAVYQTQKTFIRENTWYENEASCRATFKCAYVGICHGVGAEAVCDGKTTPDGFKREFVNLTIAGSDVECED